MLRLATSLEKIWGVGTKAMQELEKLNLKTVKDILYYFPFRWEDWTKITLIKNLRTGETAVVKARIVSLKQAYTSKKRMAILQAVLQDESGEITAVWFNQLFLKRILRPGSEWYFNGKVTLFSGSRIFSVFNFERQAHILAFYHESGKLTSNFFRRLIKTSLAALDDFQEWLPAFIRQKYNLLGIRDAIINIHQPASSEKINQAKRRLGFDELFLLSLSLLQRRSQLSRQTADACTINKKLLKKFVKTLPFELTSAQRKASWQIILDLSKTTPMNRLLQGDVGSGKTVVALMAALVVLDNNYQAVWLAPTEVLAKQHFKTCQNMVKGQKLSHGKYFKIGLLTSSEAKFFNGKDEKKIKKSELKGLIKKNKVDLIIGTHAVLVDDVNFPLLNLVIIDEQHRFGVKQRAKLLNNAGNGNKAIHFLSMSATPIPRTLTLTLYGDLDISRLDQLPRGRKKIITRYLPESRRSQAYNFIRQEIKKGRQAFIICPLIEEGEVVRQGQLFEVDRKSVIKEYRRLSEKIFPEFKISMLHGKMKSKEKAKIMKDFSSGKSDILVSTAVVEVGVDVPNATIMLIESAERFGLAQLHQFRGRVGRGKYQSYCFLLSSLPRVTRRLRAMEKEHDGFKLAELDLRLRGPGHLAGIKQSGMPDLKMATLFDTILLEEAREAAQSIIKQGIDIFPLLKEEVKKFNNARHLE